MSVKPESLGMCSARLARIDRFLAERYIDRGRLPCALLQVARGGQLVHQIGAGQGRRWRAARRWPRTASCASIR